MGLWEVLSHACRTLLNGISAYKRGPKRSLVSYTMWGYSENFEYPKTALSPPCWHPDLTFPSFKTLSNRFLALHKLPSLLYCVTAAQRHRDSAFGKMWVVHLMSWTFTRCVNGNLLGHWGHAETHVWVTMNSTSQSLIKLNSINSISIKKPK